MNRNRARLVAAAMCALAWACSAGDTEAEASNADEPHRVNADATVDLAPGTAGAGELAIVHPQNPERPYFYQFGDLTFGDEVTWIARLKNIGSAPVELETVQSACGCTRLLRIEITDEQGEEIEVVTAFEPPGLATIPAGAEVALHVRLMTGFSIPNKPKLVVFRLDTDSAAAPYVTFELAFHPVRAFEVAPREAQLLNVPTSHGGAGKVKILTSIPGGPGRVLGIESAPEGIDVNLTHETFAGEVLSYVEFEVAPLTPIGVTRGEIVLVTTDADGNGEDGRLTIDTLVQVTADAVLQPPMVALRTFESAAGSSTTLRLTALVPGARVGIERAYVETEHGSAEFEVVTTPLQPDDDGRATRWDLEVVAKPGAEVGHLVGELVVETDEPIGGAGKNGDPATELRVRVSGLVR